MQNKAIFPLAVEFVASDHREHEHTLRALMGERGLLLGFVGDIWMPSSARLLRWMSRETMPLRRMEIAVAALVSNAAHTLHGFFSASPVPPRFPLLADANRHWHTSYGMSHDGIILIDAELRIRARWDAYTGELPRSKVFIRTIESLNLPVIPPV